LASVAFTRTSTWQHITRPLCIHIYIRMLIRSELRHLTLFESPIYTATSTEHASTHLITSQRAKPTSVHLNDF
jgi:hypothetical protein